jgi:hypothetical protein
MQRENTLAEDADVMEGALGNSPTYSSTEDLRNSSIL